MEPLRFSTTKDETTHRYCRWEESDGPKGRPYVGVGEPEREGGMDACRHNEMWLSSADAEHERDRRF